MSSALTRVILASVLALLAPGAHATREFTGSTPGGAAFRIAVPDAWRSGDPLVVVNHGYNFQVDDDPDLTPLAPLLLSQGYAVAASGYRQRGWALFTALDDNAELVARFKAEVGTPGQLLAVGGSMGGLISLKMIDDARFSNLAGVYALCAPTDAEAAWNSAFDLRLAYDAVCDEVNGADLPTGSAPYPWALDEDQLPESLDDFGSAPEVLQTLVPVVACTGLGLNTALRTDGQKERLASLMRYAQTTDENFFATNLAYAIFGLSDIVRAPDKLAGRNPFDSRYAGSFFGTTPAIDARLPVIAPETEARFDFAKASVPARAQNRVARGATTTPIVALYTLRDELVRTYHAHEIVGTKTLKAKVFETTPSHCGFTEAEVVGGWEALKDTIAGRSVPLIQNWEDQAGLIAGECNDARARGVPGECRIGPFVEGDTSGFPRGRRSDADVVRETNSGLWWNAFRSGEGLLLEVLPDNRAFAAWFTYPPMGAVADQHWVVGTGTWVGNGFEFPRLIQAQGARFGAAFDPAAVAKSDWGTLRVMIGDGSGLLARGLERYAAVPPYGSSLLAFDQLTAAVPDSTFVFSAPPPPANERYVGTYYDPARDGEGVIVTQLMGTANETNPFNRLVVLWFTFDPNGNAAWLYGDATGHDGEFAVQFQRPVGARFGAAFDPNAVQRVPWGTGSIRFNTGCDNLTLDYASTQPGYGSGQRTLQRLTRPMGTGCSP